MSKRSRKERRAGQIERTVKQQDPTALEALLRSSPEMAAQHLARALMGLPPGTPSALDAPAEKLAESLRTSGKLEAAFKLAAACAQRSPRLRLEHALAAFALGKDADAVQAASADPAVLAIMTPLFEAAQALPVTPAPRAPGPKKPTGPTTRARPPVLLQGLHGVAEAVKAATLQKPDVARAALQRIPAAFRTAVLWNDFMFAVNLGLGRRSPRNKQPLRAQPSAAVRQHPPTAHALVHAVALKDLAHAIELGKMLLLPDDTMRSLRLRALPDSSDKNPVQVALDLAKSEGGEAFAPEHRATAFLYEGFACMDTDAKRAERALDRAVALGADMTEALRGKMLVAIRAKGKPCEGCGQIHDDGPSPEVGRSADRFARAIRRLPMGQLFAAQASAFAAKAWLALEESKAALASLEVLRETGGERYAIDADLREAEVLALTDPKKAMALLDATLARDPSNKRVWDARIELADVHGKSGAADALILEAAAATDDLSLISAARDIRIQRGEIAPFAGMIPGRTTAGALAHDVELFLAKVERQAESVDIPLPDIVNDCRKALLDPQKVAFDIALIFLLREGGNPDGSRKAFTKTLAQWWRTPATLGTVAAVAWPLDMVDVLVAVARASVKLADAMPGLNTVLDAALAADDVGAAGDLLKIGAPFWSRTELTQRRKRLTALSKRPMFVPNPSPLGPERVLAELERILGPEFELPGLDDDLDDDDDDDDDFDDGDFHDPEDDFARSLDPPPGRRAARLDKAMEEMTGLTPAMFNRLSAQQVAQVMRVMMDMTRMPPTEASAAELRKRINKIVGKR